MKITNKKGFTLVELIIVIAVIGVLAAILIPTFSNVIEKANNKSAYSDAKNALEIYIAEETDYTGGLCIGEGSIFKIRKANKDWYYTYYDNGLHEGNGAVNSNPMQALEIPSGSVKVMAEDSYYIDEKDTETQICNNLPDTVIIYNTGADATYTVPTPTPTVAPTPTPTATPEPTPTGTIPPQTKNMTVNLHCQDCSGYYMRVEREPLLVTRTIPLAVGDNEIPFDDIKSEPWDGWLYQLREYEKNNKGWEIIQVDPEDATHKPIRNITIHVDSLNQSKVDVNIYTAFVKRGNAPSDNSKLDSGKYSFYITYTNDREHTDFPEIINACGSWEIYLDLNIGKNYITVQQLKDAGFFPTTDIEGYESLLEGYHWELFGYKTERSGDKIISDTPLDHIEYTLTNESYFCSLDGIKCTVRLVPND